MTFIDSPLSDDTVANAHEGKHHHNDGSGECNGKNEICIHTLIYYWCKGVAN